MNKKLPNLAWCVIVSVILLLPANTISRAIVTVTTTTTTGTVTRSTSTTSTVTLVSPIYMTTTITSSVTSIGVGTSTTTMENLVTITAPATTTSTTSTTVTIISVVTITTATTTSTSGTSVTVTSTTSTTVTPALLLDLTSNGRIFAQGESIALAAQVTYRGSILPGVEVVFEVRNPAGGIVATGSASTGSDGIARKTVTLPQDAAIGDYSVYASVTYQGLSASGSILFSVRRGSHVSLTVSMTDLQGNPKSTFKPGEGATAKIVLRNDGGTDIRNAHMLVTFYDSRKVPIFFSFEIGDLGAGYERTSVKGFTLSSSATTGTYRVEVIVLTAFLADGGIYVPDGSGASNFEVTV